MSDITTRIVEQVDDLSDKLVERNAEIVRLKEERDHVGDSARQLVKDALLLKEQAERERDNWHASNYAERQARLRAEAERDQLKRERDDFEQRLHAYQRGER